MQDIIAEDISQILQQDLPWHQLADNVILVTGANGMLPAYLVEAFLALKPRFGYGPAKVIGLVRNHGKAAARFAAYMGRDDFELLVADVTALPHIEEHIDVIIHAASQASPKFYGVDPVGTISANVIGTWNILELARVNKSRKVLYFSSSEVYGAVTPDAFPLSEKMFGGLDPIDPRSCYAEGKRAGEALCVAWASQYELDVTIVRPFHTFGPGLSLDDGRVFADFIANVVNHQDIILMSDGSATRGFCYLSDATEGFLRCLLLGQSSTAYNVGSDLELSIKDFAAQICEAYKDRGINLVFRKREASGYIPSKINRSFSSVERMRTLGWQTRVSVVDAVRRTVHYIETSRSI